MVFILQNRDYVLLFFITSSVLGKSYLLPLIATQINVIPTVPSLHRDFSGKGYGIDRTYFHAGFFASQAGSGFPVG